MTTRLLVTGAGGALGRHVRHGLKGSAKVLRLSDIADLGPADDGEEVVRCDLADRQAVEELARGCDAILHLGAIPVEADFDGLPQANILGTYNLYEGARKAGVSRIIFASTNHVTGFHRIGETLDHMAPRRPDSLYGVSKCFGEDLARLYFDKFGLETACLRIGSCFPEPKNRRMLSTWLSPRDFLSLVRRLLEAPDHRLPGALRRLGEPGCLVVERARRFPRLATGGQQRAFPRGNRATRARTRGSRHVPGRSPRDGQGVPAIRGRSDCVNTPLCPAGQRGVPRQPTRRWTPALSATIQ
ncbi:hypothetical protein GGE07_001100 [Sinorhizobium terangae]|nr:hypothetical protein [Sinorhizobium terangae]